MDLSALMEPQPPLVHQQHQPVGGLRHTPPSSSGGRGGSRGGGSSGRGSSGRGEQRPSSQQRSQSRSQSKAQSQQQQSTDENAPAEVDRLCVQANRALVGRACTLMVVYYLPTFILYAWMGYYRVRFVGARGPVYPWEPPPPPPSPTDPRTSAPHTV